MKILIVFFLGLTVGWIECASTVYKDCLTLNSFYLGSTVFACQMRANS